jgi:hypothetical protein
MRNITENAESMCGLAVMNDKSECYFIEDLIFNLDKKNLSSRSAEEVKELNSYFINSLSTTDPMSDLTMWRLYGDDGQGVCIEYEVDKSILEGNSNFYLLPVDYTGSEAKKSEAVKVLSDLKRAKRVLGFKYTFTQTDIWKHFFKPKQFDVEHEVRLMYIKNEDDSKCIEKWIYNTKYSIVHPIILFNRNDNFYPLKVTKIILGPKFKESDTNKAQLRLLLDKNNWTDVKISSSEIEFYR